MEIILTKTPHSFASNTYIISCNGECAVIDPSTPYDKELYEGNLKYILLTHGHFDHMLDIDSWVNATDAVVVVSVDEQLMLSNPTLNCYKLFNGSDKGYFGKFMTVEYSDTLPLGDKEIKVISTPGHTKGSVIYLLDDSCFVGDTVFAGGGYGRFDLPTGNAMELRESIKLVTDLPKNTVLYPGHGASTTVEQYIFDFYR